jgi:hypothetical protein
MINLIPTSHASLLKWCWSKLHYQIRLASLQLLDWGERQLRLRQSSPTVLGYLVNCLYAFVLLLVKSPSLACDVISHSDVRVYLESSTTSNIPKCLFLWRLKKLPAHCKGVKHGKGEHIIIEQPHVHWACFG